MARKLRSMFRQITPLPGSGERPGASGAPGASPLGSAVAGDGLEPGAILESSTPIGSAEPKAASQGGERPSHDEIAQLAYQRWLETGDAEVQNWVWAESELLRRSER